MDITGIILAGGKSIRLGFDKTGLKIGDIPLFIDTAIKLSFFCSEIIISSSIENFETISAELKKFKKYLKEYKLENIKIPLIKTVIDLEYSGEKKLQNAGPLRGIYSAIQESENYYSFICASDMPFLSYNMMETLIKYTETSETKKDIVVLKTKKGFEALSAIYSKNCVKTIEENLGEGVFKVSDIFPYLNILVLGEDIIKKHKIDELNFFNINTIKDYALLLLKSNVHKDLFPQYWKKTFFREQAKL
jgi:molybdopterin-guanine dinucleotide biosynthesis protein A